MKQVIQLILITLVGPDVGARGVLVWEETGVPGGNPRDRAGDPIPFHVRSGNRTPAALVKGKCSIHCTTRPPLYFFRESPCRSLPMFRFRLVCMVL